MENQYVKYWKGRKTIVQKKIYAAVSLVLVSVLLLSSASYAWLVLSTSPELSGVDTTIGANGNLEIALATKAHLDQLVAKNMFEEEMPLVLTTGDPYEDNVLWGNIIDLEDPRYGLSNVILRPSTLNILNQTLQLTNPLITMNYGYDGRITYADNYSAVSGYDHESQSFISAKGTEYGVRVAGTPFDAALMARITGLCSTTQRRATQLLNKFTNVLMDIFYKEASNYTTADMQTLVDSVSSLHSEYEKTVAAVEGAFSGEVADTDEANLLKEIRGSFDSAQAKLDESVSALEKYKPTPTEENPEPDPVTLTQEQSKEILLPLFGEVVYYTKEPTEDGKDFQWVHYEDKTKNGNELKAELGNGSYFHIVGVLSGGYAVTGEYTTGTTQGSYATTTAEWTAVIDKFSQVFLLEGESMASKYVGYLAEYEKYSGQLETYSWKLSDLTQREYEAEVTFFYEYSLHPLPDPETGLPDETTQPFTPAELKAYVSEIDGRMDELEEIVEFLEEYVKSAVLVYASSGILDRQIYLDVVATSLEKASVRKYLEAAGLTGNPNFASIMTTCETARQTIADWRNALELLEADLNPKDEFGNVIEAQKRDMTVADLLQVWDIIENVSSMTLADYDYASNSYLTYTSGNFASHANDVFVNSVKYLEIPVNEGIYGILAHEQGNSLNYLDFNRHQKNVPVGEILYSMSPSDFLKYAVSITSDTYRENSNTKYLPEQKIAVFAYEGIWTTPYLIKSLQNIQEKFQDICSTDAWQIANNAATNANTDFLSNNFHAVSASLIADLVMDYVVSGENAEYNHAYYTRIKNLLDDTSQILSLYEDALAKQILLYMTGMAEQEAAKNESKKQAASETGTTPVLSQVAANRLAQALANWNDKRWSFEKLYNEISDEALFFENAVSAYRSLKTNLENATEFYKKCAQSGQWQDIESILKCFTKRGPSELVRRTFLYANVNGGLFADIHTILTTVNNFHSAESLGVESEYEEAITYWHSLGLPADVDSLYSDIGLLKIGTVQTVRTQIPAINVIAQIEYLIDRTEESQEHTVSDREFVFNNAALHMDSAAELAQRYYAEYAKREVDLLHLLYRCALSNANLSPKTEGEETPKLTYTEAEIIAVKDALIELEKAVDSALECVLYTLKASAASAATSESEYEHVIQLETSDELLEAMKLEAGSVMFDLHSNLISLNTDITYAIDALDTLLTDHSTYREYWSNAATDAKMESYLIQQVFAAIAPVENLKLNDLSLADFRSLITNLDAPYIPEGEEHSQITVGQMLAIHGVNFTADTAPITTAHNLFETVETICAPYQGTTIAVGTEEENISGVCTTLSVDCEQTGDLNNSVSWIYTAGAPWRPSASGLNSTSNHIIADTYAFAIDFLLRTNAAASNLLLQTEGIQRIYTDEDIQNHTTKFDEETLEAMEGSGSYLQLLNDDPENDSAWDLVDNYEATDEERHQARKQLGGDIVEAMRVVFVNTLTGELYGTAVPMYVSYNPENRTITGELRLIQENGDLKEDAILKSLPQNQVSAITAWVYLDGNLVDNSTVDSELIGKLVMNLQFATDANLHAAQQSFVSQNDETN